MNYKISKKRKDLLISRRENKEMCIAVPAQVISLEGLSAVVDFGGIRQEVNIVLIDNVQPGDYLLIHCGCAIERLNQEEGEKMIHLLETAVDNLNGGKEK